MITPKPSNNNGLEPKVDVPSITPPKYELRRPAPDELALIRSSWFKSYRKGGYCPEVPPSTYNLGQNATINILIGRSAGLVATLPDVPDEVLGWVVFGDQEVHYVYVKQAYRKMGVATALLSAVKGMEWATHMTRAGTNLAKKHRLQYNPFLLHCL